MNHKYLAIVLAASAFVAASSAIASNSSRSASPRKGAAVSAIAKGTFDVRTTPQPAVDGDDSTVSRLILEKQFHGDLDGISKGQMLAAGTASKGSGGYVAIERVTGTLAGRKGSFILQHIGTMNRGVPGLSISVVPDSGSDQLTGLSGNMSIEIKDGKHFYDFIYSLADSH